VVPPVQGAVQPGQLGLGRVSALLLEKVVCASSGLAARNSRVAQVDERIESSSCSGRCEEAGKTGRDFWDFLRGNEKGRPMAACSF